MNSGWYITTNDIKDWTNKNKKESEQYLSEVIEKLIRASGVPREIDFPSGDSTSTGGWDGFLDINEGNEYIPSGKSIWEFGTTENINKKAEEDYKKRTKELSAEERKKTNFVFVTSRHWKDKKKWSLEKNQESEWLNVKAINADDIKSWLHLCPAVHRWFAEKVGKLSAPIWDINQAWESWINSTAIKPTYSLLLNGRSTESENLIKFLKEESSVILVESESENESYAFCLAVLVKDNNLKPRVLIIKDQSEWDKIIDTKNTLILIPYKFIPENIGQAKSKGHWVRL